MSRLNASLLAATTFRIGIADDRGDGRPDFRYHAHVLYADTVAPGRVSMRGGTPLIIQGVGFAPGLTATITQSSVPILSLSANQMILTAPAPAVDGVQSIAITNPATGGSSVMVDAVTFGAASTDNIRIISGGGNPAVPVGGETPVPIVAQVTAADGVTPVSGASVAWSATSGMLSACGVAPACTVASDESGQASTRLIPAAAGNITVTASLAPAAYSSPKRAFATVVAIAPATAISLTAQYRWLGYGATADLPLTVRVMTNGSPLSAAFVGYQIVKGTGSLTANRIATDVNGYGTTTLHVANVAGDVQVSACVSPANAPCQTFYFSTVALSAMNLVVVGGSGQMVNVGQKFQPVIVRVTDSASPPHPVQAAVVSFQTTILRPDQDAPLESTGESASGNHRMPVILGTSQVQLNSDVNGLASMVPSAGTPSGAVELEITVSAGTRAMQQLEAESLWPAVGASMGASQPSSASASTTRRAAAASATGLSQSYFVGETWGSTTETVNPVSNSVSPTSEEPATVTADSEKTGDVPRCEEEDRDCPAKVPGPDPEK